MVSPSHALLRLRRLLNQTPRRSKVIENLAVVNYDTNNLHLAPYDWRLSCWNLEERDGYFSKLKSTIEGFKYACSLPIVYRPLTLSGQEAGENEDGPRRTFNGNNRSSRIILFFLQSTDS